LSTAPTSSSKRKRTQDGQGQHGGDSDGDLEYEDGRDNLSILCDLFRAEGYLATPLLVDSSCLGAATRRQRWFVLLWRADPGQDPTHLRENSKSILTSFQRSPRPVEAFLLPCDHPHVEGWLRSWLQQRQGGVEGDGGARLKWKTARSIFYKQRGLEWPTPKKEDPLSNSDSLTLVQKLSLQCLSQREADALRYHLISDSCLGDRFVDLYPSLPRQRPSAHTVRCLLPHSIIFGMGRRRLLVPCEIAALHGWESCPLSWKWREVCDLTGNSFQGQSVGACVAIIFALWATKK